MRLVGEGKATHTGHHAEHVVVLGVDVEVGEGNGGVGGHGLALAQAVGHVGDHVVGVHGGGLVGQGQGGVINAREVASAAGLATGRLERERVQVHAGRDHGAHGLVGLHLVEVRALAAGETVLAVELDLGRVQGGQLLVEGGGVGSVTNGGVGVDADVGQGGVAAVRVVRAGGEVPGQVLGGVVEVHADVLAGLGGGGDGGSLGAGELQLLDQVLVGQLGEASALLGVQENVVHVHGHLGSGHGGTVGEAGGGAGSVGGDTVHGGREREVELHFVVLQGDQGQGQAGGLVEEEDQGHVEALGGADGLVVHVVGHATVVHAVVVHAEDGVVGAEPVVVVLVDALATDLELHILQQLLGGVEGGTNALEHELDHDVGDQVTVTGDLGADLVAEANGTVDGLLNGLNGEVGVAAVHGLEESNLGVASQVHVLGTIGDEL
ncbi:hypothetical protein ATCV1_z279R [Acanthocystis turfacea chlorella virus 1]|uniref:Uncharacterized protein z279R n=1 Tax=Chlorovirus heliozoae TaxID=322019 RepID=A7K8N9_9PHYC|nr:hypothetical protein ATCV1_z279R [Acanthocystis turfacea chlorella virus 1]ABT16413.1 hypothetical protein ATCV1_z279R [Acanthocystis turfacea chlorella virus 1]